MEGASEWSKYMIETEELAQCLDSVKIVNASWYMPNLKIDAWQEHLQERITADTVFFDHDVICIKTDFPHTMPTLEIFTENMKKLKIAKDDKVVVYDGSGMFAVARAQWMMKYFGAENVRVLNGGFKKWKAEGRQYAQNVPQEKDVPIDEEAVKKGNFAYTEENPHLVIRDIKNMHEFCRRMYQQGKSDGPL